VEFENIISNQRNTMPDTISRTEDLQIIGGVFSKREDADRAVAAFRNLGVPDQNIQIVAQLEGAQADAIYTDSMVGRGFARSQAEYYDKAIRVGKTLIAVHNVTNPKPIIDVFDQYKSDFNPNGTRNVRQDVFGMTAGAAIGATALGTAGAVVGGPVGAAAGVAAGTVVGGAIGAAAGKVVEHDK
jgi:hypothetical protein